MSIEERAKQDSLDDKYVSKVLDGDTEAFRYFIKQYKDMPFSVAISIVKDKFLAEEVTQEAFINVFKELKFSNPITKLHR